MFIHLKVLSTAYLQDRFRLALVLLATLAVIALPLIISLNKPTPSADINQASTPKRQNRPSLESEIITITPTGFEPAGIVRLGGRFILVVDNRSGLREVAFKLASESGSLVREVRMPKEQPDWDQLVELHPGNYVLTEINHPGWSSRITITEH